jgi:hypothetical protein
MISSEKITEKLLDKLWDNYCQRVSYANHYAELVRAKGGVVINDHCAFRTFNTHTGGQPAGTEAIGYVLECLGYVKKDPYHFPTKHLNSFHYQHENINFPKFFVSQLEVSKMSENTANLINETVKNAPDLLAGEPRELLAKLKTDGELPGNEAMFLVDTLNQFFARPWENPTRKAVEESNKESQFAAWTLLHGNSVNHFTAYINYQKVLEWSDIEETIAGMKAEGIPMKSEIEGVKGSKLRQSSTAAVMEKCAVIEEDGSVGELDWSYAYYELAERNYIEQDGQQVWFNGFLGEQATNLFEMTKVV